MRRILIHTLFLSAFAHHASSHPTTPLPHLPNWLTTNYSQPSNYFCLPNDKCDVLHMLVSLLSHPLDMFFFLEPSNPLTSACFLQLTLM